MTVFTAPTPLRAGPVDISVLLQDLAQGRNIQDARVTIQLMRPEQSSPMLSEVATHAAATNKLYSSAKFELPAAGEWRVRIHIEGSEGRAATAVTVDAIEPLPRWRELWGWIALPVLPILLFGIHLRRSQIKTRGS